MQGLKTRESKAFEKFFQVIQDAAMKKNAVFFGFAGEGRDIVTDTLEGEDFSGWLIPTDKVDEFEAEWNVSNSFKHLERWSDYFIFAIWEEKNGEIKINFEKFN